MNLIAINGHFRWVILLFAKGLLPFVIRTFVKLPFAGQTTIGKWI